MIKMANKGEFEQITPLTRDELLKIITELTIKIRNKALYGRFKKLEIERMRIQWDKLLTYVAQTYSQILKDSEIEEIKRRLNEIEERLR